MDFVHFIGIGGAGMSGLAEILLAGGTRVSGSDLAANEKTDQLAQQGAKVFIGHKAEHLSSEVTHVVYSSAVKQRNPEFAEAKRRGLPLIRRAEYLGKITESFKTIAVAGTHGKTTTTAMIAQILIEAALDPLVSVGASIKELGNKNARAGNGAIAAVEADEYDRSFLALSPYIAVITTLEEEHLDIYGSITELENAFVDFANRTNGHEHGFAVVNIDEPSIRKILSRLTKRIVTFGQASPEAKYRALDIRVDGFSSHATILRANESLGELTLRVPGEHNIKNALAAIAVADILAIPFELTSRALGSFQGAERRMQMIGETGGVLVIDDYAHHPTEVRATLSALRKGFPDRKIIAAFQPHTYTRTRDFAEEFGKVFAELADEVFLADIYPAREEPIPGVTSQLIYSAAKNAGQKHIHMVVELESLPELIGNNRKKGDVVITLGAGTITTAAPLILRILRRRT